MFPLINNDQMIENSFLQGQKIEYVMKDEVHLEKWKNQLWKKLAPVTTFNVHRIDFQQMKDIVISFFSEISAKHKNFENVSLFDLVYYFSTGAGHLFKHNPSKISVELTSAKSIYLFAEVSGKNIYSEFFFDEVSGKFATAAVNIYENKKQVLAYSGTVSNMTNEIDEHLRENKTSNYLDFLQAYSVSDNTVAFTNF